MQDPSFGVPTQLLPHIHLISTFRYPLHSHVTQETIADYLLSAPNVVQNMAFNWTYLDAPPDGSLYLVWQPLSQMGTHFASDGYIWAEPEQAYTLEAKGYNVEMYMHRCGYHPPNEQIAAHCRRRYRLTAPRNPPPNTPQPDPSLWIVHYSICEPQHRIPATQIPMTPRTLQVQNMRRFLQSQGQLVRKEFMLKDKSNWPTISLPGNPMQNAYPNTQAGIYSAVQPPGAATAPQGRGQQPGAFMPYQQGVPGAPSTSHGPSPAKRPRQTPPTHSSSSTLAAAAGSGSAAAMLDSTIDDEEDTSRGDMLDHLTPREISQTRYIQHHEWMEEVLSSPYSMGQIVPVDLGLGLKGELESLTKGIFEVPGTKPSRGVDAPARIGKMDPAKAEEFRKRADNKIAEIEADMEKMRKKHAKRMALLQKGNLVKSAEARLREAMVDPSGTGTEIWRMESQSETGPDADDLEGGRSVLPKTAEKVDDIVSEIEASLHKHVEVIKPVICVQRGGLEEKPTAPPSNANGGSNGSSYGGDSLSASSLPPGSMLNGTSLDGGFSDSAGGLLDQLGFHTSTSTPGGTGPLSTPLPMTATTGISQTYSPASSAAAVSTPPTTGFPGASSSYHPSSLQNELQPAVAQLGDLDVDVEMAGILDDQDQNAAEGAALADWVVVDKTSASGTPAADQTPAGLSAAGAGGPQSIGTPGVAFTNTPGSAQGFTPGNGNVNNGSNNMVGPPGSGTGAEQNQLQHLHQQHPSPFGNPEDRHHHHHHHHHEGMSMGGYDGQNDDMDMHMGDEHEEHEEEEEDDEDEDDVGAGLDLDDSAFGDAVYGTEMGHEGVGEG